MKTLMELRRYPFNTVSFMLTMYIGFLILFFGAQSLGGDASWVGEGLEALVVGYLVWMFSLNAYQDLAWTLHNEAQIGTLEQLYLAPAGFTLICFGMMAARFLYNLILSGLLLAAMMLTSGYRLHLDLVSLIPLALLVIAAPYGFGFIMGGLALVFSGSSHPFKSCSFSSWPSWPFRWTRTRWLVFCHSPWDRG